MEVYVVIGGFINDRHIIAIYDNKPAAKTRAEKENKRCKWLSAYVDNWSVEK